MSFRAVGVSRIRAANSREISLTGDLCSPQHVISSGVRRAKSRSDLVEKSPWQGTMLRCRRRFLRAYWPPGHPVEMTSGGKLSVLQNMSEYLRNCPKNIHCRRRGAHCASAVAVPNVLLLSTLGQENNVGAAGLQCKPLQVELLTYCCFGRLAHFLYMSFWVTRYIHMSFQVFNTFPNICMSNF